MITILGATGFIGSHLVSALSAQGIPYQTPARDADLRGQHLGRVIYCIGLTADFRTRPFDTVDAHVSTLARLLQHTHFDQWVYLSSTRIYNGQTDPVDETAHALVNASSPSDLYNLSKLMGESLTLHCGKPTCVVRLSNVYGNDWTSRNFLPSVIREAVTHQQITLQTSLASCKDYVCIDDVVKYLIQIALNGRQNLYHVASGENITHEQIVTALSQLTGCGVTVAPQAPTTQFPTIRIDRLINEFGIQPKRLLDELPHLVARYQQTRHTT